MRSRGERTRGQEWIRRAHDSLHSAELTSPHHRKTHIVAVAQTVTTAQVLVGWGSPSLARCEWRRIKNRKEQTNYYYSYDYYSGPYHCLWAIPVVRLQLFHHTTTATMTYYHWYLSTYYGIPSWLVRNQMVHVYK